MLIALDALVASFNKNGAEKSAPFLHLAPNDDSTTSSARTRHGVSYLQFPGTAPLSLVEHTD